MLKCRYTGCRHAECRDLFLIILNVIMLSVIMPSVIMPSVVAPKNTHEQELLHNIIMLACLKQRRAPLTNRVTVVTNIVVS